MGRGTDGKRYSCCRSQYDSRCWIADTVRQLLFTDHWRQRLRLTARATPSYFSFCGAEKVRLSSAPASDLCQVRYRPGEKFTWHLDALPPSPELAGKGGQRIATLLVYLTEMPEGDGGATAFRDLGPLRVRPRKVCCGFLRVACGFNDDLWLPAT